MKHKALILALVAVGLVVAATSAAFHLRPSTWFAGETPAVSVAVPPTSSP